MKTLNKFIITFLLMVGSLLFSYGQTPKIIATEERSDNGHECIVVTLDNGVEMHLRKMKNNPNQLVLTSCDHKNYRIPCLGQVAIPNQINLKGNTFMVDSIGNHVFYDEFTHIEFLSFTSVSIPNSVTGIAHGAFNGCSKLTSIVVEKGNKKYDSRGNCNAIIETATNTLISGCRSTIIPESVTSIGDGAFESTGLTSIIIPQSVTSIGNGAFSFTDLASITIPNSVTSIGNGAFLHTGLTSVTIPNSVTSIGEDAFLHYDCNKLTSIIVEKGNKKYDSRNNCNAIIETASNTLVSGCNNTIIPNTVTNIGKSAFMYCKGLTSFEIPNGVTSIGENAFRDTGLTSITIPNSVTSIGEAAFYGCSSLTSIFIPNSMTSIGNGIFKGCSSLTSIIIPNSVTSIGDWAFLNCNSLVSITIPNSVTSIGEGAFESCRSLTSITIPNSVTSIGEEAFYNCENLDFVEIENPTLRSHLNYDKVFDEKICQSIQGGSQKTSQNPSRASSSNGDFSSDGTLATTTFSYQTDIMPYLRGHRFVTTNGDRLTFTNSGISNGTTEIGVTQYEVLGWDSMTALLKVHTPYGTPPIIVYIYAAEGHIIIDDVWYFAK